MVLQKLVYTLGEKTFHGTFELSVISHLGFGSGVDVGIDGYEIAGRAASACWCL